MKHEWALLHPAGTTLFCKHCHKRFPYQHRDPTDEESEGCRGDFGVIGNATRSMLDEYDDR